MSTSTNELGPVAGNGDDSFARRYFPRNVSLLVAENAGFSIALAFVSLTTVMPTFVTRLGGSAFLVGLIGACQTAGMLLTQIIGAGLCAGKPRMRPYILWPLFIGRPSFLLVGALVYLLGTRSSTFLLAFFFVALFVFFATDGVASVAWYELIGKTVPPNRRGRMFGAAQVASGLGGMAVGWLVGIVLGNASWGFPYDYGLLFLISGGIYMLNLLPFILMKEPVGAVPPGNAASRRGAGAHFLRSLVAILRNDKNFVRVVGARLLYGVGLAVFPFYVLFLNKAMGYGPARLGLFTSAQVFGVFVGGLSIGWLADRVGTRAVVRVAEAVGALIPALALLMILTHGSLGGGLLVPAIALFVFIGVATSANMIGFANYVLEAARLEQRSTYIGLFNAFAGTLLVASPLAGWLLEQTSFTLLFLIALASSAVGLLLTGGLRAPAR